MELELGLALPISSPHFPTRRIISCDSDTKYVRNNGSPLALEFKNLMMLGEEEKKKQQKRSFANAFDIDKEDDGCIDHEDGGRGCKTLSLLVWSGRRRPNNDNGDDDDGGEEEEEEQRKRKPFYISSKKDEEDDEIVGWPPIRTWRKKLLLSGHGHIGQRRIFVGDHQILDDQRSNNGRNGGTRNSIFVKVKMEGVVIGRKIDLMLFNSYQALSNTLLNMFAKYKNNGDEDDGPYVLSYLDKQGDWLLVGDVPWQRFIESVQRMEIIKRSS